MANVVRLKASFISAPIHFSFRAEPSHQQPVLMPSDFRDRYLRYRNERLPLATAIAAAWLCAVARPWHGATRQPGWLAARVPSAETPEGAMRIAFQSRIQFDLPGSWPDRSPSGGLAPVSNAPKTSSTAIELNVSSKTRALPPWADF